MAPRSQELGGDPFALLLKQRIVFLGGEVNDFSADAVISQILLLDSMDPEKDIKLFINSPGGSVTAGLGIYDARIMAECTGKDVRQIDLDTDRDRYMSPIEAKEYGIIDEIIGGDDAVSKVQGDTKYFPKTKEEYISWWREAEGDSGERSSQFTGKPVEPYKS